MGLFNDNHATEAMITAKRRIKKRISHYFREVVGLDNFILPQDKFVLNMLDDNEPCELKNDIFFAPHVDSGIVSTEDIENLVAFLTEEDPEEGVRFNIINHGRTLVLIYAPRFSVLEGADVEESGLDDFTSELAAYESTPASVIRPSREGLIAEPVRLQPPVTTKRPARNPFA